MSFEVQQPAQSEFLVTVIWNGILDVKWLRVGLIPVRRKKRRAAAASSDGD